MPPTLQATLVLGPARSGKTHELLTAYHDTLTGGAASRRDHLLWLAPNSRAAAAVRSALIERGLKGCLSPGVTTFNTLAREIVAASPRKLRPIAAIEQREILRRVVRQSLPSPGPLPKGEGSLLPLPLGEGRGEGAFLHFYAEAALRPGFIDLLAGHIRELKQHHIHPTDYARLATKHPLTAALSQGERELKNKHQELAALYAAYEKLLTEHQLVDSEGLHLAACDALARNDCRRFAELDLIVVDGFNDFTRAEQELLRQLAARASRLMISLPMEAGRPDLFAKPAETLAELRRLFSGIKEHTLSPRPAPSPALDYVTQQVFRFPQADPPADTLASLDNIEIIEAAGTHDEIVQLARRIKSQLAGHSDSLSLRERAGVRANHQPAKTPSPDDIVVIFRSIPGIAPRIEEVFTQYGIPFALESSPPIARAPLFKTLVSLLRLAIEDWPFRDLIAVITNNSLTAINGESRTAADWLVRDLQVASGRQKLLDAVANLAAQQENIEEVSDHRRRRIMAAAAARPALEQLSAAIGRLPQRATANEWIAAIAKFGGELGLAPFVGIAQSMSALDNDAWAALANHFAKLERLDGWLKEAVRPLDLNDFLSHFIDIATNERLRRPTDEAGRVRILSAQSACGVSARHVYLAGMSEQAFPASTAAGQLASEAEYRFFTRAANPDSSFPRRRESRDQATTSTPTESLSTPSIAQDEMLLFYEVLSRAEESLTISYPAMDDKAQVLPPSPYVVELTRMFRGSERKIPTTKPQLSPIESRSAEPRRTSGGDADGGRSARGPYSIADWRIDAVSKAVSEDRNTRLLAGLFANQGTQPLAHAIDAGLRIVHARARGDYFGPSEGVLISPAIAARLAQRFGPKHSWSPSQFETYAACPYKFFLEDVLKLEPLGDIALETDHARRGSLLHQVLAAFHRKYGDKKTEWAALARDETRFTAELLAELQAAVATGAGEGIEAALTELDRRQIAKWADAYFGQHEKYDKTWDKLSEPPRPAHFELRFGRKHQGEATDEDKDSVDKPFELEIGKEKISIAGRIDRIDVGRDGDDQVFNVIDFKSGKRPTLTRDKIESGERLQPALYVMAAQAVLFDKDNQADPLWAGYWSMQSGVTTQKKYSLYCTNDAENPGEGWAELKASVEARIAEIVHGARTGAFPVKSLDQHCTRNCEFKTVCRIAQARIAEKVVKVEGVSR